MPHTKDRALSDIPFGPPLLGPSDPPPFEIYNSSGSAPLLIVSDHADAVNPSSRCRVRTNRSVSSSGNGSRRKSNGMTYAASAVANERVTHTTAA